MFTKTVVLPVAIDEAFALITEPERLRRWQARWNVWLRSRAGAQWPCDRLPSGHPRSRSATGQLSAATRRRRS